MASKLNNRTPLFLIFFILNLIPLSFQQTPSPPPPPDPSTTCNGVFLSYTFDNGYPIFPTDDPLNQPYRFDSTILVRNNARDELKSWKLYVGFKFQEILVSATNSVLADGTSLPAFVGNGTVFSGFPATDLKTAIETAGDLDQMMSRIQLVGTRFGNGSLAGQQEIPLPGNLTLLNDGYTCPSSPNVTESGRQMFLCCIRNLTAVSHTNITLDHNYDEREKGDLIIMYDVITAEDSDYWAQVSITIHNDMARLDNWQLSWDFMRGEFINSMKGAIPNVIDTTDCIFGAPGQFYRQYDFSKVLSCEQRPTIIDLPPTRAEDNEIGKIPFCCRNGTILPPSMDSDKSSSVFQMQVYKIPPDLNRTAIVPPQNWKINGTMGSNFQCDSPIQVSPSQFPDLTGLPSVESAIASWQIVCNVIKVKDEKPKCCVTFSAFFNESVIPCSTCACGCSQTPSQTCSANTPALLLPPDALLVPFENRTAKALQFASDHHRAVPNPLPCGDNCGVSINWHLLTDYKVGWTARITLFNWQRNDFPDWFAAVQLDQAGQGFEKIYSFNGSALPDQNNTIFMRGLKDFTYLLGERDSANPRREPPVPGSQQSVILFSKKNIPELDVAARDGFPTKVIFNGEECAIPTIIPINAGHKAQVFSRISGLLITLLVLFFMY